jgi:peptide/nickel transport system ATP-binding protein
VTDQFVLEVNALTVRIRTENEPITIVDAVSFSLAANEVLCVVGESGSGKSVSMMSVMRLMDERITEYEGSVRFDGVDLLQAPLREVRKVRGAGIAMIFQDPMTALNPVYSLGWQIEEQLTTHTELRGPALRERVLELLRQVGLPDPERAIHTFPHQLSGGMRQRVMIALALSCRPKVLIADEPTTALDVTIQAQILSLLSQVKDETGMAVVLVTHDMGVVAEMADRVQVMYGGRIVERGSATDIFDDPQHPYTWGLLGSIPRLDRPKPRRLAAIAGTPATAGTVGSGCVFADRCAFRFDPCDEQPPLAAVGAAGHEAACHLPLEQRATLRRTAAGVGSQP